MKSEVLFARQGIVSDDKLLALLEGNFKDINDYPYLYAVILAMSNVGSIAFFRTIDCYRLMAEGLIQVKGNKIRLHGKWGTRATFFGARIRVVSLTRDLLLRADTEIKNIKTPLENSLAKVPEEMYISSTVGIWRALIRQGVLESLQEEKKVLPKREKEVLFGNDAMTGFQALVAQNYNNM